jgi:hypothetical protein
MAAAGCALARSLLVKGVPPTSKPKAADRAKASPKTKQLLYALSAGYCQFEGCPKRVLGDDVTERIFNTGQVAHNVGASADGPRGDAERSAELVDDVENVMLLCYEHHRLVDEEDPDSFPEERLRAMKRAQEERVALVCGIAPDKKSHVLVYGSSVGTHPAVLGRETTDPALLSRGRYPAAKESLQIQTKGDLKSERSPHFWESERANLLEHYRSVVRPYLSRQSDPHVSVFAFAAQPLLVLLGSLLSDKFRVDVFQRHRVPVAGWAWPDLDNTYTPLAPSYERSKDTSKRPALVISLSATITDDRVKRVLGEDCSIWHVRIPEPNQHCIRSPADLVVWHAFIQRRLDEIKTAHGHGTPLHIFPAMPNSAAVALGLVRQEKADMPFHLYDALPEQDFTHAFIIE